MSLIDSTYFVLDINIPSSNYSSLTAEITKYEKEVLIRLLGYDLYVLVAAYNAQSSPQRIIDIVEGKDYTIDAGLDSESTVAWNGLVNTELISLIAYYVFYWHVRNGVVSLQNVGVVKSKQENAANASNAQLQNNAFTRFKELYGFVGQNVLVPSCYNFLIEHEDTYPEWIFTKLGSTNALDL